MATKEKSERKEVQVGNPKEINDLDTSQVPSFKTKDEKPSSSSLQLGSRKSKTQSKGKVSPPEGKEE